MAYIQSLRQKPNHNKIFFIRHTAVNHTVSFHMRCLHSAYNAKFLQFNKKYYKSTYASLLLRSFKLCLCNLTFRKYWMMSFHSLVFEQHTSSYLDGLWVEWCFHTLFAQLFEPKTETWSVGWQIM